MTFRQKLSTIIAQKDSLLSVGLDPRPERLPAVLQKEPDPLLKFCQEIVAGTAGSAAAFKINFAFFEVDGARGWAGLEKLVTTLPSDVVTIADAKRGDIASSAEMYARGILQRLGFDAVTVNPYLGGDGVQPFLQWEEKGAFVLCLTSNPGAQDFQYISDGADPLYLKVAAQVRTWNARGNCGLVVGATRPDELRRVRTAAPDLPLLIPGLGAQGGDLREAVLQGTARGGLALFNASRSILYKSSGINFAEAAAEEAERLRKAINEVRRASGHAEAVRSSSQ